jgi:Flp pilus assembly protein TadD
VNPRPGNARRPHARVRTLLSGIVVFLTTFAVFSRCARNDFVDWDDPGMLLENLHYRGLGLAQLRWMFTTFHMGHYQPLSWVSLALDFEAARACFGNGLDPRPYHLTNVLLHSANAVLVFLLCVRLLRGGGKTGSARPRLSDSAAAFAALAMALHPLRVESVAWVTERRDVLSSFFLLLTVLVYLRAAASEGAVRVRWLGLALFVYVLSLLSRAMGVTLPIILLLLDWFPLKRIGRWGARPAVVPLGRAVLEKLPFAVFALGAAFLAPLAQRAAGATATLAQHGLLARGMQASYGLVFYLWKTLLPAGLSPIYEMRLPIDVFAPRYVASAALVLGALVGLVLLRRRQPALVVALACYAILLAPVAGLVQSGNQEAADRYSYLPSVTLSVLMAAGLLRLFDALPRRVGGAWSAALSLCAAGIIVVLVPLTWRQSGVWRNTTTLWTYAARVSPTSSIAQNGYGWVLLQQKRYDEALQHLRRAIELRPTNSKAHYNIWIALREQGRSDELLQAYRDSIRVYPTMADAYYNLGNELRRRGALDEALANYRRAVELQPSHARAQANLAYLLGQRGDNDAALAHYAAALRADPRSIMARRGYALLLKKLGRDADAIEQIRIAGQLDPNDATAQQLLTSWSGPGRTPR